MATVKELIDSRDGTTSGLGPIDDCSRTFRITLDSVTQNPRTILAAAIPLNSYHPEAEVPTYAYKYEQIRKATGLMHFYRVLYRPIDSLLESGWKWQTRFNRETKRILVTRDHSPAARKLIGPHSYRPTLTTPLPEGFPGPPFTETPSHLCPSGINGNIDLIQTQYRRVIGYEVPAGGLIMTFDNEFATINPSVIYTIAALRFHINNGRFLNFTSEVGTVMFTDAHVRTSDGVVTGSPEPPVGAPIAVTLEFSIDPERHSPAKFTHTYIDDDGNEVPVYKIGEDRSVVEDFEVGYYSDLSSIFNLF